MSRSLKFACAGVAALIFFAAAPSRAQSAPAGPALTYRKIFKGSSPEYIEVTVRQDGTSSYDIRQLSDAPDPQPFGVSEALAAKIFELCAQLDNLNGADLDTRRRIANLGQKTFIYERAGRRHEATFNYTLNLAATQLMNLFEGLARQQEHLRILQHRMKYDRLGVNSALLSFESDLDRKVIPEPERLLPALEQLAGDARYVEIARQRARMLIDRIRAGK
jgi:hypothetical protein